MRISILTPAHNEEQHIGAMIESLRAQSHDDWELIIVDDRSADATAEIARSIDDARIVVVQDPSVRGKNAAFNAAFRASTGDAIMMFGADDLMPAEALALRIASLKGVRPDETRAVSYGKVQMFSDDKRYDGVIVPRGPRGSRAGGTMTLTRALAEAAFPLSEALPNEDIWISAVAELCADVEFEVPEVVTLYRIHSGNSFKRTTDFGETNTALASRNAAFALMLEGHQFGWNQHQRDWLARKVQLEEWRNSGKTLRLISARGEPISNRIRLAVHSSKSLFRLRALGYRFFSGW